MNGVKKFILDPKFGRVMRKLLEKMRPWKWCLVGGRAVEVWTNPPQTPDVDVLAEVLDEDVPELTKRLAGCSIELDRKETQATGLGAPMLFFRDRTEKVEVDILGAYDVLHFSIVREAIKKTVQGVQFPVARAEDIVIMKAQAVRDPGRPKEKKSRDRRAIAEIARAVKLDKSYIAETLLFHRWRDELAFLQLFRIV